MADKIREKKWYALYTQAKWEKKINNQLHLRGIESWCPLQKVEKKWSDRKKIIEEPLFRSYVFVKIDYLNENERNEVAQTPGVLRFVYYLRKPAVIKNEEVENIKRFINEKDAKIEVVAAQGFVPSTKVVISQGLFIDKAGTIIKGNKQRVYVQLQSLGQIMIVEFPIEHLLLDLKSIV